MWEVLGIAIPVIILLLFVLVCRSADAAQAKDDAEFANTIKHLPIEKQAELLLSKMRHDAERDLY